MSRKKWPSRAHVKSRAGLAPQVTPSSFVFADEKGGRDNPKLEPDRQPHRFALDLPLSLPITYKHTGYLQDNLRSLTTHFLSQFPGAIQAWGFRSIIAKANLRPAYRGGLGPKAQAVGRHGNFNVSKILPLTPLRTIDLGGKKSSDPLFSRFCAETRVFFEVNSAPKNVQSLRFASRSNRHESTATRR